MKRMFFALWPDDNVRRQCANIVRHINNGKIQRVCPANIHVTLLFLGNVALDKEARLRQEASIISVPRISLIFNQLSFWNTSGILCLTVKESNKNLIILRDELENLAEKSGIVIDGPPFSPHVTLLRKAYEPITLDFEPIIWHATSFCLVESVQQLGQGVVYRVIEQWTAV